jgi:hypothetical protein
MKLISSSLALFGCLWVSASANATVPTLPECAESVCSEIFHNKESGKASVIVWNQKGTIASHSFDLESTAVKGPTFHSSGTTVVEADAEIPPMPCNTGSCATSSSTTYATAGSIITVTITYTYYNGTLLDASISEAITAKP